MASIRTLSFVFLVTVAGCEFGNTKLDGPGPCATVPQCVGGENPDPISTCNAPVDQYDCTILALATTFNEPDPMIFKAQIRQESAFDMFAISPDSPCGEDKAGWTVAETKSFGLMQLTPACGWLKTARLPDGHPNLAHDETSPEWATSVFNPGLNIGDGVSAVSIDRALMIKNFPGCTGVDYTKMALGAFNQGPNSVTGCNMMSPAATNYVSGVLSHHAMLSNNANWPVRY